MSSSYFYLLRRLKDSNAYVRELAKQFALFRSVSDQVDNPRFKSFNRLKNYRLILRENPTIAQAEAGQWKPFVPSEGQPRPPPPEQPPAPPPPPTPPAPPPPPPTEFVYPSSNITADGFQGSNTPANVNDNNFFTGWLAPAGFPHWIKVDLGSTKRVQYLTMNWTYSNNSESTTFFNVETSTDNTNWTNVFNGSHTNPQGSAPKQTADIIDNDARYVRINVTGRNVPGLTGTDNFGGMSELDIWGVAAGTPPPPPVPPGTPPPPGGPIQDAKFSIPNSAIDPLGEGGDDGANVYTNVNDGNLNTRWSKALIPEGLQFDLGEVKRIAYLRVAWYRGNERTCGYSIRTGAVAGGGMTVRKTGTSSGTTTGLETYDFPDVNARWVDFICTSNSQSNFTSITEIEIWGGDVLTTTPPPPGPPAPPAPGPPPPGVPPPPPSTPNPQGQAQMMLNFNNTIQDESGFLNHAQMDGGTMRFAPGATSALGNSIDLNPLPPGSTPPPGPSPTPPPPTGTPPPSPLPPIPPGVTNRIRYCGGPVLNKYNPEIINIWWGSSWNSGTPASRRQVLINDMNTICNSQHFEGMWQYRWTKKPRVTHNIVWTGTPVPSGSTPTEVQIENCIQDVINSGQVPNPDNFGEPFPNGTARLDYRHIYLVILPFGKLSPHGDGYAYQTFRNENTTGTKGTVWWMYCAIRAPDRLRPDAPQYNEVQMFEQAWAHEIFHHMESAVVNGGSTACDANNGWTGHLYFFNGECAGMQHSSAGCGSVARLRVLSGTSVLTESYWSDQDGKCIAPGSGESWTRPPAGAGGSVPPEGDVRE